MTRRRYPYPRGMKGVAFALGLLICTATAAQAQQVKPGLWEYQHDIRAAGQAGSAAQMAQLQAKVKSLPPHVRQMMERQMAGMGVGMGDGGALRVCMSPDEARQGPVREGHRDSDCTYTQVRRSGDSWSGRVTCTDPARRGEFKTTLHSAKHFTTSAVLTGADGRADMKLDARYIAADCGALTKPARR